MGSKDSIYQLIFTWKYSENDYSIFFNAQLLRLTRRAHLLQAQGWAAVRCTVRRACSTTRRTTCCCLTSAPSASVAGTPAQPRGKTCCLWVTITLSAASSTHQPTRASWPAVMTSGPVSGTAAQPQTEPQEDVWLLWSLPWPQQTLSLLQSFSVQWKEDSGIRETVLRRKNQSCGFLFYDLLKSVETSVVTLSSHFLDIILQVWLVFHFYILCMSLCCNSDF